MGSRCTVYGTSCPEHGFYHGAEAEELRQGIERILHDAMFLGEMDFRVELQLLLDRVDARDSLAYLEAQDREGARQSEEGDE